MAALKRWEADNKENMFPFCSHSSSGGGNKDSSSTLKSSNKKIGRTRIPLQDITNFYVSNINPVHVQVRLAPFPNNTAHRSLELKKKQCPTGVAFDRGLGLKSSAGNTRSEALRKGFR